MSLFEDIYSISQLRKTKVKNFQKLFTYSSSDDSCFNDRPSDRLPLNLSLGDLLLLLPHLPRLPRLSGLLLHLLLLRDMSPNLLGGDAPLLLSNLSTTAGDLLLLIRLSKGLLPRLSMGLRPLLPRGGSGRRAGGEGGRRGGGERRGGLGLLLAGSVNTLEGFGINQTTKQNCQYCTLITDSRKGSFFFFP